MVLALPRGGVPVGFEIAESLGAPLDVLVVRKLGAPGQPELALGAIASGGILVINEGALRWFRDSPAFEAEVAAGRAELHRRERVYRDDRPAQAVKDRTVVLVSKNASYFNSHRMMRRYGTEAYLRRSSHKVAVEFAIRNSAF